MFLQHSSSWESKLHHTVFQIRFEKFQCKVESTFLFRVDRSAFGTPAATMSPAAGLSVVELGGDPGQSPLEVGEHELECLGPLLFRVELGFDGIGSAAAARVFDLALLNVHPGGEMGV